jgi:hypothetical protein
VSAYADYLEALDSDQLINGLASALGTTKDWLTPGQIRELCVGMSAADELAAMVDDAWAFVTAYQRDHGADGKTKSGHLVGHDLVDGEIKMQFAPDVPAPEIPPSIASALEAIGSGTVLGGLTRIAQNPPEDGWLHKEFAAAMQRALRMFGEVM